MISCSESCIIMFFKACKDNIKIADFRIQISEFGNLNAFSLKLHLMLHLSLNLKLLILIFEENF
jgi:hypothetical protein